MKTVTNRIAILMWLDCVSKVKMKIGATLIGWQSAKNEQLDRRSSSLSNKSEWKKQIRHSHKLSIFTINSNEVFFSTRTIDLYMMQFISFKPFLSKSINRQLEKNNIDHFLDLVWSCTCLQFEFWQFFVWFRLRKFRWSTAGQKKA